MNWSIFCPWRMRRGKKAPLRRQPCTAQLAVEALECRLMPSALATTTFHIKPLSTGSTPSGYTPLQILEAYNFYSTSGTNDISFDGVAGNGAGQTIAIVDAYDDPNIAGDLAAFDAEFHLAAPPSFSVLNEHGQTTSLPGADPTGGWEMEEALDVEWAHAIAPGASIVLVEANGPNDADLDTAVTTAANLPGVSVISMSWAGGEFSGENSEDSVFTTPSGHQGVTFVAASGDSGSPSGYPAYSPNVVAVGGTSLYLGSNNSYQSESAWSGSGGGASAFEPEPAYQRSVQSTGKRTVPDVAFDANPNTGVAIYDSYDNPSGPWTQIGGTSMAAPSWAAIMAIANQGRVAAGETTLNGPTQTLPALYSLPASAFHDITTGSNGTFSAEPGYDEVTGLGTPVANSLIPDLVSYGGQTNAPHLVITAAPPNAAAGAKFGFTATVEIGSTIDTGFNGSVTVTLSNNPGGSTLSGTLTVTAVNGVATFSGLSLNNAGTGYTLSVSASGVSSGTTSPFNITQSVHAPVLQPIGSQTVVAGSSINVTLNAADPQGLPLTYTASVGATGSQAYQLKQQLGLQYMGSYYTNEFGQDEKWMSSASGTWYCILPSGQVRRWAGTMAATLSAANLIATLSASYYANPSLLWDAQAPITLAVSVKGNQLSITAPAGVTGTFQITATASNGVMSASQTFTVTVAAPLQLTAIPNQTLAAGGTLKISLSSNAAGTTYSASVLNAGSSQAYQLEQQLQLRYMGTYFTNEFGQNEKWMSSASGTWYCILPNGQLRRWAGTMAATMQGANLIATLSASYYANPSLLWNAQPPSAVAVSVSGNQLTINAPAGVTGSFQIQVVATVGGQSVSETFTVTVTAK